MGNDLNKGPVEPYVFKPFVRKKVTPQALSALPQPRSGHRIVCDSKNLYSFGGYNPHIQSNEGSNDQVWVDSYPLFQELWRFNFASRKWLLYSSQRSLPRELASNAVLRKGNTLMVYGGTGSPFGYRCSNKLFISRLNEDAGDMFEVKTDGQEPIPQYGQALVYHHGYLYTIGGTTGFAYTCDIHRLELKTGIWEDVYICQGNGDYEPFGRYRHEVAFDGTNIYILGGGTAEEAYEFGKIPVFNVENRRWNKLKTINDSKNGVPQPRRCHGAVQISTDNDIHVFISGGYDGLTVFDDIWKLELSTLRWTLIETCTLALPSYFHSSAVTPEGKMYIFGGIYATEEIERSNDIHSMWVCIPKLSEMCWEALLHYNPDIVHAPREKLINLGLLRNYIQRLE